VDVAENTGSYIEYRCRTTTPLLPDEATSGRMNGWQEKGGEKKERHGQIIEGDRRDRFGGHVAEGIRTISESEGEKRKRIG